MGTPARVTSTARRSDARRSARSGEAEPRHELLPPRLERYEIRLAEHATERVDPGRILRAVRPRLAVEPHQQPALLQVVAEVPRRRVVRPRILVVERVSAGADHLLERP